tara:strand:- start:355 stop:732 length:378 start_codon:yes stop_codon:yes gene_type:complete
MMNLESIGILVLLVVGYFHLINTIRNRSVSGLVNLCIESDEKPDSLIIENKIAAYTRICPFIITPVPGMEYFPGGFEGGQIKRVIIDELGLLEVACLLDLSKTDYSFDEVCESLNTDGWREKVYV